MPRSDPYLPACSVLVYAGAAEAGETAAYRYDSLERARVERGGMPVSILRAAAGGRP